MSAYQNATILERKILVDLIKAALALGYTVSVNDGEEWTLFHSVKIKDIVTACATTGCDLLKFYTREEKAIGTVMLVWGNGEDLISDHSDNIATIELVESIL